MNFPYKIPGNALFLRCFRTSYNANPWYDFSLRIFRIFPYFTGLNALSIMQEKFCKILFAELVEIRENEEDKKNIQRS